MEALEAQLKNEELMESEINPLMKRAESIVIKDDEDCSQATIFVKQLKNKKLEIDDVLGLTAQTKSSHTAWKFAKDRENKFLKPFDDAVDFVKRAIKSYETKKAIEQRKAEQEKAEKEKEIIASGGEVKSSPIEENQPIKRSSDAVKKMVWKARCVDIKALCKAVSDGDVPESVIDVNGPALNRFAVEINGTKKINGIEFYEEVDIRIR